jgi:hypothetical protein
MKDYRPARKRATVSVGESVRLVFPGWTHEEAA